MKMFPPPKKSIWNKPQKKKKKAKNCVRAQIEGLCPEEIYLYY